MVLSAFQSLYLGLKVMWEIEKESYEAEFVINGKNTSENYAFNGKRTAFEIEIE